MSAGVKCQWEKLKNKRWIQMRINLSIPNKNLIKGVLTRDTIYPVER